MARKASGKRSKVVDGSFRVHGKASNGEGSIYCDSDGSWRATYRVPGERSQRRVRGRTREEAIARRSAKLEELSATISGDPLVKIASPTEVTIDVVARPMISDGKFEGAITVSTDSPSEPSFVVPTIIEVLQGGTTVSPPLLNFRDVIVTGFSETKIATFTNCTAGDIEITGILLDGEAAPDFDIIQIMPNGVEQLPPFTLARNGEIVIAVQMLPRSDGTKEAQISIDFQEPGQATTSSETVALLGEGFFRAPDRDSYYRCSSGSPVHALPLVFVGAWLVVRRRRRR